MPVLTNHDCNIEATKTNCITLASGFSRKLENEINFQIPQDISSYIGKYYYKLYYKNVLKTERNIYAVSKLYLNYHLSIRLLRSNKGGLAICNLMNGLLMRQILNSNNKIQCIIKLKDVQENPYTTKPKCFQMGIIFQEDIDDMKQPISPFSPNILLNHTDINTLDPGWDNKMWDKYQLGSSFVIYYKDINATISDGHGNVESTNNTSVQLTINDTIGIEFIRLHKDVFGVGYVGPQGIESGFYSNGLFHTFKLRNESILSTFIHYVGISSTINAWWVVSPLEPIEIEYKKWYYEMNNNKKYVSFPNWRFVNNFI